MKLHAHLSAAALAVCILACPGAARAQATSAAAAEKLFQDGRALMGEHRYADACPKLAESLRLDPAVGTALNLGECYERLDKLASAWATYRKAETMARRAGQQERNAHAAARAEALERSLSYLTVAAPTRRSGLVITRDGERIGEPAWGSAVPIDGGVHVIEASAPGFRAWKQELRVAARGARVKVDVPELAADPAAAAPTAPAAASAEAPSAVQRTVGWISVATGVVALGTGFAFGVVARSKNDDAGPHCSAVDCDGEGVTLTREVRSAALVSTVLFAAGGVLTAGGVILVLTAPDRAPARVGLSLSPSISGVWGTF